MTAAERATFLGMLAQGHTVTKAAALIGHGRSTVYELRQRDADFAKQWDLALDVGVDALEEEARRRAFEGVERDVFYQGEKIATVRDFSDTLLIQLLRVRAPSRWGNRLKVDASIEVDIAARILAARKRAGIPETTPAPEEAPAASLSQDIADARTRAGMQTPEGTDDEPVDPFS